MYAQTQVAIASYAYGSYIAIPINDYQCKNISWLCGLDIITFCEHHAVIKLNNPKGSYL